MTNHHGFELISEQDIPELNTTGKLYRHIKTGAQLLSMENQDENKVFSINFRTTPEDSTGVAHILEHAVLNGSEKYPVKEPFVELVKGSLQTFVNALTFADKTSYPVASQNLQDFYNLIDVYMDATLHPLIPRHVLDQEGWHFDFAEDGETLEYQGVVYNEMKGALSDPNGLLEEVNQQSLFPDNLYRHNSGGAPENIPDLTYEQFKAFHDTYYHPSNAFIFMYGDDDPEERLRLMSEYLAEYEALEVDSEIPLQPPFSAPVKVREPYAVSEGETPKYYVCVNWALPEQTDPQLALGLSILNHILIGTPASPLRKALIDSGYGEDLTGAGLGPYLRQMTFSTGMKGVAEENVDKVEALLYDTLQTLVQDGIEPDMIEASVNTVEFRLRENNTGSFPRGILLMLRALTTWLYDGNPFAPLLFEAPLEQIKARLDAGEHYFESLIRTYFMDNPHRSTVVLTPDTTLNKQKAEEEKTRAAAARAKMSEADLKAIAENAKKLKQIQETPDTPEALTTLPVLALEDLDKENKRIPLEVMQVAGVEMLYHDLFTNGIVYLDAAFDLHSLPQDLLPYLTVFAASLTRLGTKTEDFVRLSQRIGRETGGVSPMYLLQDKYKQDGETAKLVVRAKAVPDQVGEMNSIISDILLTTEFDNLPRFKQIVAELKAQMESVLIPSGHSVINRRLHAGNSTAGWLSEQLHGLESMFFIRQLMTEMEEDWAGVVEKLNRIRQILVQRGHMMLNLTVDSETLQEIRPQLEALVHAIPEGRPAFETWQPKAFPPAEGLTIPTQVNYVGKGANLYKLGYEPHGSQAVIRKYMGTTYIWEKVRVQGGAYGGYVIFDLYSGTFNYLSYRDPNVLKTLDNYDRAPEFLLNIEISPSELTKAIIGSIGDMDAYQLPDAKGYVSMTRYLSGYSDQDRQQIRDELLSTSVADFKAFGEVLAKAVDAGRVVVLGDAEAIAAANQERDGFMDVKTVL